MEDSDFNDPLPPPGAPEPAAGGGGGGGAQPVAADAESIEMLSAMGFTPTQAADPSPNPNLQPNPKPGA